MPPLLACGPTGDAFAIIMLALPLLVVGWLAVLLMTVAVWSGRGPRSGVPIGAGAGFMQIQVMKAIGTGHVGPDLVAVLIVLGALLDVVLIAHSLMRWSRWSRARRELRARLSVEPNAAFE